MCPFKARLVQIPFAPSLNTKGLKGGNDRLDDESRLSNRPVCQFAILEDVQLLGKNIVDDFKKKHPLSRKALDRSMKLIEGAKFDNPKGIKEILGGNVDFVGGQAVFDVGVNKIRAITKIAYGVKVVLVTHILTHAEYEKNKWKKWNYDNCKKAN